MTSASHRLGASQEARDPAPVPSDGARLSARALEAAAAHPELVDRSATALIETAARLTPAPTLVR